MLSFIFFVKIVLLHYYFQYYTTTNNNNNKNTNNIFLFIFSLLRYLLFFIIQFSCFSFYLFQFLLSPLYRLASTIGHSVSEGFGIRLCSIQKRSTYANSKDKQNKSKRSDFADDNPISTQHFGCSVAYINNMA